MLFACGTWVFPASGADFDPCISPNDYPGGPAEYFDKLLDATKTADGGRGDFKNPPVVRPISEDSRLDLIVDYANNRVMSCDVRLRSYNGGLLGPTIRARPGDTLYIRLINRLPTGRTDTHPQNPPPHDHTQPFSFNITNLHTHGLNTSPGGNKAPGFSSDNVLLEVHPGEIQDYRIHIHDKHPTGTFWYHAHVHGATALQLSSGMAGALVVEGGTDANGGLDSVPEIAAATEKIFVLQQLSYLKQDCPQEFGNLACLESFDNVGFERIIQRPVTINGQFVPVIRMRPGEVQRWRFIHAGITEVVQPVVGDHKLYEIAVDGLALGRIVAWPAKNLDNPTPPTMVLAPGNRSDVLIKAGKAGEYALQTPPPGPQVSIRTAASALLLGKRPESLSLAEYKAATSAQYEILAKIVVEGEPLDMPLPRRSLADRIPYDLRPITSGELDGESQTMKLIAAGRTCNKMDGRCSVCKDIHSPDCLLHYMVGDATGDRIFMPKMKAIILRLGSASEWKLAGTGAPHPFHIHVNPFLVQRDEPDETGGWLPDNKRPWVWKDAVQVPISSETALQYITIRSRYSRFTGKFVLHCHILGHEDAGMMQLVEISK